MDVVCDRCKTEYEFDDALVSERGTTVKCTNCGHQFKIFRAASEAEVGRVWNLRRPDGTVIPFDSLAVLQKWILEGRVAKMDEIARPGDPWKSLGAIAELESFFMTAEARSQPPIPSRGVPRTASAGRSLPPLHRGPTPPTGTSVATKMVPARVPPPPASTGNTVRSAAPPPVSNGPRVTPPLPRAPGGTTPGFPIPKPPGVPGDLAPRPVAHEPPAVPAPPPPSLHKERHEEPARTRPSAADVPGLRGAPAPSPDLSARDDDSPTTTMSADEFAPSPPPRRGGLIAGLAIGALVAGVAAVTIWRSGAISERPSPAPTAATPRVRGEDLTAALSAARGHTRASYDDAREALTRLLGADPRNGAVLAARAGTLAAWAEMEQDHAGDLERRAGAAADGAALRAEAAVLRRDAAQRIERARADLSEARDRLEQLDGAMRADAEAAMLDASRVTGARAEAQRYAALVRARAQRPAGHDVSLALLARDEGDAPAAVALLQAALGREDIVRARVALARLLLARGDIGGARAQVDAVLARGPGHEDATLLATLLAGADAGAPAVVAAPALAAAPAPVAAPVVDAGARAPAASAQAGAPTLPRDYDRLVAEGDRLQNDGRTAAAEERYRAALAVRPNGAEALTGMGYVEIDRRNYSGAISRFRQALQSNGNYSDAYIGMGEAYASQSRYQQALDAYNRYLEVNPNGSRASMARRQIESLQERVRHTNEEPAPSAPSTPAGGNGESDG